MPLRTQHFINGEFVNSVDGKTFQTINPATEEVLATVQQGGKGDIDKAVAAARLAFDNKWETTPGYQRRDLINKLADIMEENQARLGEVESLDNGKPQHIATNVDVQFAINHLRYFAGLAESAMQGATIPIRNPDHFSMTLHEPVGVVGAIIPWNFPILMLIWKLAPILASGCTVVFKTSEKTPLSALLVAQLVKEAGIPDGVVNIVSGYGNAGADLAKHMDVDKVAFTGSSAVGHKIIQYAGQSNMKRVTLELGGKSPFIICADADLDQAVGAADLGLFFNAGQCCCASTRLYVEEAIYDEFVKKAVELARQKKELTISPQDPDCFNGPQVDKIQFDKIMNYIDSGKSEGATLAFGGKRLGDKGFFIEPTVFSDVQDDMTIAREEIFGPVMQIMKFTDLDDAIKRANDTTYGLAAGICTRDIGKAIGVAKQLKAGTIWINTWNQFDDGTPFGGYKGSGWGREKSKYALDNYKEVKCIEFPINDFKK